ncbi:hypothetical protein GCM10011600_10290 [Pseudolysinimonas yzui]|uniref:Uncharacterized protein n=1 Tax=Pseudolysinimonas yzui TaxID=2708254 RepID=A0A8J3M3A5_9MICO|nr:hypothetical protein GCM10011600_10290 [Pseudolysinimonas yzui]
MEGSDAVGEIVLRFATPSHGLMEGRFLEEVLDVVVRAWGEVGRKSDGHRCV